MYRIFKINCFVIFILLTSKIQKNLGVRKKIANLFPVKIRFMRKKEADVHIWILIITKLAEK